jgi:hypothetical protein
MALRVAKSAAREWEAMALISNRAQIPQAPLKNIDWFVNMIVWGSIRLLL